MATRSSADVVRSHRSFGGHGGNVGAVALTPNGKEVVTAGADGSVRIWNRRTGELVRGRSPSWTVPTLLLEILNGSEQVEVLDEIRRWLDHRGL